MQSTTPDKPPIATVPKVATNVAAVPRRPQTSAGWIGGLYDDLSRNHHRRNVRVRPVTCRHGFELGQLGGLRLAPLVVILDWGDSDCRRAFAALAHRRTTTQWLPRRKAHRAHSRDARERPAGSHVRASSRPVTRPSRCKALFCGSRRAASGTQGERWRWESERVWAFAKGPGLYPAVSLRNYRRRLSDRWHALRPGPTTTLALPTVPRWLANCPN